MEPVSFDAERSDGPEQRYPFVFIIGHWTLAVLAVVLIAIGFILSCAEFPSGRYDSMHYWHRSLGTIALPAVILLLVARFRMRSLPQLDAPRWQRVAAGLTKASIYALLILIPTSKLVRGAFGLGFEFFGLRLPAPFAANRDVAISTSKIHYWMSLVLILLLVLHASAAAWHKFILRDNVVSGMIPNSSGAKMRLGFFTEAIDQNGEDNEQRI